jgi:hypothetical protein
MGVGGEVNVVKKKEMKQSLDIIKHVPLIRNSGWLSYSWSDRDARFP